MAKTGPQTQGGLKLWRVAYPQAMLLVYAGIVGVAMGYLFYTYNRCAPIGPNPTSCNPLQGLGASLLIAGAILVAVGSVVRMFRSTDY